MGNFNYSFSLRRNLTELDTLCKNIEKSGQFLGLSQKCMFEINLCIEELFTNIISYGFKDDLEHPVKVTLERNKDWLVLCVEDEGMPFNPVKREAPELSSDIEDRKIGGLGIHIIKELMSSICYERYNGRNVLTLKKYIAPHLAYQ